MDFAAMMGGSGSVQNPFAPANPYDPPSPFAECGQFMVATEQVQAHATHLAFDPMHEALWSANSKGGLSVHTVPDLQLLSRSRNHLSPVSDILPINSGLLSLSADELFLHDRGGLLRQRYTSSLLRDMSVMGLHAAGMQVRLSVACAHRVMSLDLATGQTMPLATLPQGVRVRRVLVTSRSIVCARSDGQLSVLDPRAANPLMATMAAHDADILDADLHDDVRIATVGTSWHSINPYDPNSPRRPAPDRTVRLLDLRSSRPSQSARTMVVGAPRHVRWLPTHHGAVVCASDAGDAEVLGVDPPASAQHLQLTLPGTTCTAAALSPSSALLAASDTAGVVKLHGVMTAAGVPPSVNLLSSPLDAPDLPCRPPRRSLAPTLNPPLHIGSAYTLCRAVPGMHRGQDPGAAHAEREARDFQHRALVRCHLPPQAAYPALRSTATDAPLLASSYSSKLMEQPLRRRARRVVRPDLVEKAQRARGSLVAAVPNPGVTPNSATLDRATAPAVYVETDPRFKGEGGGEEEADLPSRAALVPHELRFTPLRLGRFGISSVDFSVYNTTSFAGFENASKNAYAHAALQLLYFLPEARHAFLAHGCDDAACLACEVGTVFAMLDSLRSVPARSRSCVATEFLRTLQQTQQANTLGLVEEEPATPGGGAAAAGPPSGSGLQPLARRLPFLVQFLFRRLCSNLGSGVASAPPLPAAAAVAEEDQDARARPPPADAVPAAWEQCFGASIRAFTRTADGAVSSRDTTRYVLDLVRPRSSGGNAGELPADMAFADLLAAALCEHTKTRAWSASHGSYVMAEQRRLLRRLPGTLVLNCVPPTATEPPPMRWADRVQEEAESLAPNTPQGTPGAGPPATPPRPTRGEGAGSGMGAMGTPPPRRVATPHSAGIGRRRPSLSGTTRPWLPPRVGVALSPSGSVRVTEHGFTAVASEQARTAKYLSTAFSAGLAQGRTAGDGGGASGGGGPTPSPPAGGRMPDSSPPPPPAASPSSSDAGAANAKWRAAAALTELLQGEGGGDGAPPPPPPQWSDGSPVVGPGAAPPAAAEDAVYDLHAVVSHVANPAAAEGEASPGPGAHIALHVRAPIGYGGRAEDAGELEAGARGYTWLRINDFSVARCDLADALDFRCHYRRPCLLVLRKRSGGERGGEGRAAAATGFDDALLRLLARHGVGVPTSPLVSPPSPRSLALTRAVLARAPGGGALARDALAPLSSAGRVPRRGAHVAIDCEFVALAGEESTVTADGRRVVTREPELSVGRVSLVDEAERVLLDVHVRQQFPVMDHQTRWSGLTPRDLDPATSPRPIVPLKAVRTLLQLLIDGGCVFIAHGGAKDWRVLNLVVPPKQQQDTMLLFRLPARRNLSLRYLAAYFLRENVHSETHDSVVDAVTALRLFQLYTRLADANQIEMALLEAYSAGEASNFKEANGIRLT